MPASVVPISARRQGAYVLLEAALPERAAQKIGVFLLDTATGTAAGCGCAQHFDDLADPEDAEVLEALEDDIRERAGRDGRRGTCSGWRIRSRTWCG